VRLSYRGGKFLLYSDKSITKSIKNGGFDRVGFDRGIFPIFVYSMSQGTGAADPSRVIVLVQVVDEFF